MHQNVSLYRYDTMISVSQSRARGSWINDARRLSRCALAGANERIGQELEAQRREKKGGKSGAPGTVRAPDIRSAARAEPCLHQRATLPLDGRAIPGGQELRGSQRRRTSGARE